MENTGLSSVLNEARPTAVNTCLADIDRSQWNEQSMANANKVTHDSFKLASFADTQFQKVAGSINQT